MQLPDNIWYHIGHVDNTAALGAGWVVYRTVTELLLP